MNIGVIPARLNSQRFPRKILALIKDKPLIAHVAERVLQCKQLDKVIVAIDSEEVRDKLSMFDFEVVMTSPNHPSGTDRVAEAVTGFDPDVIVNIQGDEPLIDPQIIDDLIDLFQRNNVEMATAVSTKIAPGDYFNENIVKAFLDDHKRAVSFRRNLEDMEIGGCYKHLGIYAYTRRILKRFVQLPPSKHEIELRLEQWRALDNGIPIHAIITDYPHHGVDIPADIDYVLTHLRNQ